MARPCHARPIVRAKKANILRKETFLSCVRGSGPMRRTKNRCGFISVGAVCQRIGFLIRFVALLLWCGSWAVLRSLREAAGRVNSSLRSHRTWRSHCRHVFSGLNKTMYASVGPNSRYRGHRQALRAEPWNTRTTVLTTVVVSGLCLSGRMKAGRGHRLDVTCAAGRVRRTTAVFFLCKVLLRLPFEACVWRSGLVQAAWCDRLAPRSDMVACREPSRTACAAVDGPWPRWPWPCRCAR